MAESVGNAVDAAADGVIVIPDGLLTFGKFFIHLKELCHTIMESSNGEYILYTDEQCECFLNKLSIISDILSSCEKEDNLFSPELVHGVRFIPEKFRITKPSIHKIKTEEEQEAEKAKQLRWKDLNLDHIVVEGCGYSRNVPLAHGEGSVFFFEHAKCTMNPKLGLANQTDGTLKEMATYTFFETVLFGRKYSWLEMYKKICATPLPPRIRRELCTALFRPLVFLFGDAVLLTFTIFSCNWSSFMDDVRLQIKYDHISRIPSQTMRLIAANHDECECTNPEECCNCNLQRYEINRKMGDDFNMMAYSIREKLSFAKRDCQSTIAKRDCCQLRSKRTLLPTSHGILRISAVSS